MSIKKQTIRYGLFLLPTLLLAQTGTGLTGDYFGNTALTGTALVSRTDATINFDWGSSSPAAGIAADRFSARWTGQVEAPVSGSYSFITYSDDGIRLWVDGKLVIERWNDHGTARDQTIAITLVAGRKYDVAIEYYENIGNANVKLAWTYPGQTEQIIPQTRLYPAVVVRVPQATSSAYVSDLTFLSANNGWGPVERDRSNNDTPATDGKPITLDGKVYAKGLGVHANSEIRVALNGAYSVFKAMVGVDDEVGNAGSVTFEVWLDGTRKFESAKLLGSSPALAVEVPVTGAQELKLIVTTAGDGNSYDHADWADARLEAIQADKYLSDLTWVSAINGRGAPQLDRPAPAASGAAVPARMVLRARPFTKGLGTFPTAEIKYNLEKKYEKFTAIIGIDDTAIGRGSVIYEVWSGTTRLYQSAVLRGSSPVENLSIDVKDKSDLILKVLDAGDGNTLDIADWADAKLTPLTVTTPTPPTPSLPAAPASLTASAGNALVNLTWQAVSGATSYNLYRGTAAAGQSATPIATGLTATAYSNTGLTNGTTYYYLVRAVNSAGAGSPSNEASAKPAAPNTPLPAPSAAPTNLTATAGNAQIVLTWGAATGATSYSIYRGTATNAQATTPIATNVTTLTYTNTGLTNGTTYFYKVVGVNATGAGPSSAEKSATPLGAPVAPVLTAVAADARVTLSWATVNGAVTYRVYRGTTANGQVATPIATDLTTLTYANTGLTNGTAYFYKVTAVNTAGESPRSNEASGTPSAAATPTDPSTLAFFRLVRQTSWGPKPGEVDRVKAMGRTAYLDEQFNMAASAFPDSLYATSIEDAQEHFYRVAITGNDQLRQRVAFVLSKIWSVNAGEVNRSDATVAFYRIFLNRSFGNYRDLMTDITLNPNMGRYLNMLNSKSQALTGSNANENYARELMQLFTLGLSTLNNNGSSPGTATYTEDDVKALARIFTGWTFGDGNATSIPTNSAPENWVVPMEPVDRFHDITAKTFLGINFAPNRTTKQDLDQALDVIFNHPNLPPFVAKHLIQQLVTSNPSPGYISAVANAFINNGGNVRGDMRATLRVLFNHPEANLGSATQGKLMEPVLLVLSPLRTLNAAVSDYPFMATIAGDMGQRVLFPPSVFSYFSPQFQIRNGALLGPEFQLLTSASALTRANYIGRMLNADLSGSTTINYAAFTSKAADAAALVDYVALQFMGGQISSEMRSTIISAVSVSPAADTTERVRTAIYLVCTSAQYQVDR